jgi:hypothetical protein
MNIINAGNPSANNMIVRQVMQKKRESSATIFDKLNKRTAKLTAKNPLNNMLTNDQLFRYYTQEVEPKLSQSTDNFPGLPNTTLPDNSIKDTVDKDFGNGTDEHNAGTGGGGGGDFGPLNSNKISRFYPNLYSEMVQMHKAGQDNNMYNLLTDAYLNDKPKFNQFIRETAYAEGVSTQEATQFLLEVLGISTGGPNVRNQYGYEVPGDYNLHDLRDEYTDEFLDELM